MSLAVSTTFSIVIRRVVGVWNAFSLLVFCALTSAGIAILMQPYFAQAAVVVQEPMSRPSSFLSSLRAPPPPFITETAVLAESRRFERSLRGQSGSLIPFLFPKKKCLVKSLKEYQESSCARQQESPLDDL